MNLVRCTPERHAEAIRAIFNEAIAHSTAIYDYHPRTAQDMAEWFRVKAAAGHPVLGLESETGELLGFGSYGPFRSRPAYKYTVEHSVYVHTAHRGRGIGEALLREVIACAEAQDLHVLVGAIDAANQSSIALHERLGFVHAGTIAQAGFKFGRWLDLAFYQKTLKTPLAPVDG